MNHNVVHFLRTNAAEAPKRSALVFGARPRNVVTFGELWARVDAASVGLRKLGIEPGDRVITLVPMGADLYVLLLAVLKLGAIAVFVDPWVGRRLIADFAAFAHPRAWLGSAKSHLLRLLDARLRSIPIAITTGRRLVSLPAAVSLASLLRENGDGHIHAVGRNDSALVTFTSGSSGRPKGVDRTHGFLAAQHHALQAEFPYEPDDVDMPMFPVFALNNLAAARTSVVPSMNFRSVAQVDGATIGAQMRDHAVTTCTASPVFVDRLAVSRAVRRGQPPALRRILCGGAPVSDAQLQRWRSAFPDTAITIVYGSTEAEPVAHVTLEERVRLASSAKPSDGCCVGRPSPRVRTRVLEINNANRDVPQGAVGELAVAADHVCRGYFRNPAGTREHKLRDADGTVWHRMGDTGYFDADGRFWLVGRVHSTIRRARRLVHPQMLEQVAHGDDARITRIAAVGIRDAELGERVVVVVEPSRGAVAGRHDLRQAVEERLSTHNLPADEIMVTSRALPLDPRHSSKVDYATLRQRLARDLLVTSS